ncbi:unnamed protein product, partial [Rotaria sordida]
DLNSPSMYEAGIAMSDLSCFINSDLARDLANDIMTLMTSTKPYILFLNNPDILKSAFPRLNEKLEDSDSVLISISSDLPNHNFSIQLGAQKLRILIEDSDRNLKYIALLAMPKILHTRPKSVQSYSDLIMRCLDDKDESIPLRGLDPLFRM